MNEQEKLNEFGASSYEEWLKLVERDLAGAPFEKKLVKRVAGVDIRPLYTRKDREPEPSLPGFAPFRRGGHALGAVEMGWEVRHEVNHAEPASAAAAALDALQGGVTGLTLRFDRATRHASEEHGADGLAAHNLAELERALGETRLDWVPVHLKAGVTTSVVAAALLALAQKRGLTPDALTGTFGADPLALLASHGSLPGSLEAAFAEVVELARYAREHAPRMRTITVDTTPYHDAGADAGTEIAVALAAGVTYLRVLTDAGLSIDDAATQICFDFSIGRDVFVEIAKLRAARLTWSKLVAACGGSPTSQVMLAHASTSRRTKTQRDPWVNLLRGTGESFAAAIGGADAITTLPFDALLGESDDFGARMARNTQELLRHESNLHRVVDPAGGSWYVEEITDALARRAWEKFTSFEKAGGLVEVLKQGALQKELAQVLEAERKAVETRKLAITGVNEFPHVKEEAVERPKPNKAQALTRAQAADKATGAAPSLTPGQRIAQLVEAAGQGHSFSKLRSALVSGPRATVTAVTMERLAQPFEALRDAADGFAEQHGKRPAAFLVNLGPIPEHKARAGFAQNYLEAGGFSTIGNDGFSDAASAAQAFAQSGAQVAVLCSSDSVYAELAVQTAEALRAKGAKLIALAGSPGEQEANYRAAGITDFIFVGANVAQSLRSLLERVGAK